ncbi:MAG: hypothetical protein IKE69_08075 [Thermoguttaceae bacterium]|nr:hypothetical protein [Thermoguttaceae bacterium]
MISVLYCVKTSDETFETASRSVAVEAFESGASVLEVRTVRLFDGNTLIELTVSTQW